MENSAKLVDFILEKEQREKAKRRRLLTVGGGVAGALLLFLGIYSIINRPDGFRRYDMSSLTVSQIRVLFKEDPRPILIRVPDQEKPDTVKSAEEFVMLLTSIYDSQNQGGYSEADEGALAGTESASDLPMLAVAADGEDIESGPPLKSADIMPSFPGGEAALYRFLSQQVKYPEQALKDGVEGEVYVRFVVEPTGAISDVAILRGIGSGCDEEAIRVVKMMPLWIPGESAGRKVPVISSLAINFRFL